MKPIDFERRNVIFAKNQPQYLPLPAYKNKDGQIITCWKLDLFERIRILFTGKLFLRVLTFNQPLQPLKLEVKFPEGVIDPSSN